MGETASRVQRYSVVLLQCKVSRKEVKGHDNKVWEGCQAKQLSVQQLTQRTIGCTGEGMNGAGSSLRINMNLS